MKKITNETLYNQMYEYYVLTILLIGTATFCISISSTAGIIFGIIFMVLPNIALILHKKASEANK